MWGLLWESTLSSGSIVDASADIAQLAPRAYASSDDGPPSMSVISFPQALTYGLVQGLTEFLPISSSAHLRVVPAVLGWSDPGAPFTAVIQLGTMAAIVAFFWRELLHVTIAWCYGLVRADYRSSLEYRMGWYLIFATIPVAVLGLVFSDQVETAGRNLWLIAVTLIVMSFALLCAERVGKRNRDEEELTARDAAVVGVAQALALVPGASRSGATITAGLFRGLDRPTAARFSFLLSVPAVVASGLFEARKIGDAAGPGVGVTAVAIIVSFGVGLASIAWLMRFIAHHSTLVFVGYRIVLGGVLIGLLASGVLDAT